MRLTHLASAFALFLSSTAVTAADFVALPGLDSSSTLQVYFHNASAESQPVRVSLYARDGSRLSEDRAVIATLPPGGMTLLNTGHLMSRVEGVAMQDFSLRLDESSGISARAYALDSSDQLMDLSCTSSEPIIPLLSPDASELTLTHVFNPGNRPVVLKGQLMSQGGWPMRWNIDLGTVPAKATLSLASRALDSQAMDLSKHWTGYTWAGLTQLSLNTQGLRFSHWWGDGKGRWVNTSCADRVIAPVAASDGRLQNDATLHLMSGSQKLTAVNLAVADAQKGEQGLRETKADFTPFTVKRYAGNEADGLADLLGTADWGTATRWFSVAQKGLRAAYWPSATQGLQPDAGCYAVDGQHVVFPPASGRTRLRVYNLSDKELPLRAELWSFDGEPLHGDAAKELGVLKAFESRTLESEDLAGLAESWIWFARLSLVGSESKMAVQNFRINPDGSETNLSCGDWRPVSTGAALGRLTGKITGYHVAGGDTRVQLTGRNFQAFVTPATDGSFSQNGIPEGRYSVKLAGSGIEPERERFVDIKAGEAGLVRLVNKPLQSEANEFRFHWEADSTESGSVAMTYTPPAPEPELVGEPLEEVLPNAELALNQEGIYLSNAEVLWSPEMASRLHKAVKNLAASWYLSGSVWQLTDDYLANDVEIGASQGLIKGDPYGSSERVVRVSRAAFRFADARSIDLEGRRKRFYSKRLLTAVLRAAATKSWNGYPELRSDVLSSILQQRFNLDVSGNEATTLIGEPAQSFQTFQAEELLQIFTQLEAMPEGLHGNFGLKYLFRRANGVRLDSGKSLAKINVNKGYIEYSDAAFPTTFSNDDLQMEHEEFVRRLTIAYKAYFLWQNFLDDTTRKEWIALGAWYPDPQDPDKWLTDKMTGFYDGLGFEPNPVADFASATSAYVANPEWLKTFAPEKFEFLRDRLMKGEYYRTVIRPDLTFKVYNLEPDYVYPGKIKRIDLSLKGAYAEDKKLSLELELEKHNVFSGARYASIALQSRKRDASGQFQQKWMYVYASEWSKGLPGHVLKGELILSSTLR